MTVNSMTGFARHQIQIGAYDWIWEVKSVNGRNLDTRCRFPSGYEWIEAAAREAVTSRFRRGHVTIALHGKRAAAGDGLQVNQAMLGQVLVLAKRLAADGVVDAPRLDGLLTLPGMLGDFEESEADLEAREVAMRRALDTALDNLAAARRGEGARVAALVDTLLGEIEALVEKAVNVASVQPAALRQRLKRQVEELLQASPALPEDRLAQEAALLASKADVREELDRLRAHIAGARELLRDGGAIGRRCDFLCQELNREANTLCSKAADVALTRIGLSLKASVEQLREQIQNIE